jgi:hypothetical protein
MHHYLQQQQQQQQQRYDHNNAHAILYLLAVLHLIVELNLAVVVVVQDCTFPKKQQQAAKHPRKTNKNCPNSLFLI